MKNADRLSKGEVIYNFIKQFYAGTPYLPKTLLIGADIEDKYADLLEFLCGYHRLEILEFVFYVKTL